MMGTAATGTSTGVGDAAESAQDSVSPRASPGTEQSNTKRSAIEAERRPAQRGNELGYTVMTEDLPALGNANAPRKPFARADEL